VRWQPNHRIRRDAVVIALAERDGDRCWYCGCAFDERGDGGGRSLTIDHVEPLAGGGASDLTNLRLSCATCNRRKGQMGAYAYAASELLDRRRRQIWREELDAAGVPCAEPTRRQR
jgi:5-methylcytosine-specific restriction endonuclease McrA